MLKTGNGPACDEARHIAIAAYLPGSYKTFFMDNLFSAFSAFSERSWISSIVGFNNVLSVRLQLVTILTVGWGFDMSLTVSYVWIFSLCCFLMNKNDQET